MNTAVTGTEKKTNPWIIAFAVSIATFMEVLDTTITNVSLTHIAGSLGAGQDEAVGIGQRNGIGGTPLAVEEAHLTNEIAPAKGQEPVYWTVDLKNGNGSIKNSKDGKADATFALVDTDAVALF